MPIRLKCKWHYPNCVARNRAPPSRARNGAFQILPDAAFGQREWPRQSPPGTAAAQRSSGALPAIWSGSSSIILQRYDDAKALGIPAVFNRQTNPI